MSWVRFDDRAAHHRKVKRLSDAAFRLWFSSICHCAEYLTNGRIDAADVADMPKAPTGKKLTEAIADLVEAGCWDEVDGGWEVHDYLDWNPTADEVKAKREARAEAGRQGGQLSGKSRSKRGTIAPAEDKQTGSKNEAIASAESEQTGSKNEAKTNPVPVPIFTEKVVVDLTGLQGTSDVQEPPPPPPRGARLSERLTGGARDSTGKPTPRVDPLAQRIQFLSWFPSSELVAWYREQGLSDRDYDETMIELRDKTQGFHDFSWWDTKALRFLDVAIERRRSKGASKAEEVPWTN